MFNVGGGELLVILIIALIVLGPTKLPGAAKQAGGLLNQIRKMSNDFKRELQDAVPDEINDLKSDIDRTRRSLRPSSIDNEIERKARERGRAIADGTLTSESASAGEVSSAAAAGMFIDSETNTDPEAPAETESETSNDTEASADPESDLEATTSTDDASGT